MDQADALHEMLNVLQRANEPEVLVYTGYTIEELRRAGGAPFRLLARIDILVDGPFIIERPSTLVWRGSDNQRVHLLTPRARQHAGAARRAWGPLRSMQYMLEPGGRLVVVGIPHRRFREDLASATARRGIDWEAR
jgi:anaerobic ribonucleoside-triphosphate reductase activating protein